ncbi:hypothetical protein Tco_1061507 [Tanacetum coccineum]
MSRLWRPGSMVNIATMCSNTKDNLEEVFLRHSRQFQDIDDILTWCGVIRLDEYLLSTLYLYCSCGKDCGGPHETYQCQPMNEDYYHEQNSCYDYNSFGFDQFQPPQYTVNHLISNVQNSLFNAQNEFLNSQNKLMEQMTSICDMVGQIMQKKEEERRIAEEQAAKDRYWKIPICYDDDEDYTIAITPLHIHSSTLSKTYLQKH